MASAAVLPFVVLMITASSGWTAELQPRATSPAAPATTEPSTEGRRYQFRLTKGHGLPVCEAYLQRLNQTQFSLPPYCGRPENDAVPGFALLERHWMSRTDFDRIFIDAINLVGRRPPLSEYVHQKNADGSESMAPSASGFPKSFAAYAWSYDPEIDINNDGSRERVVVFSYEDRNYRDCGQLMVPGVPNRGGSIGLIVNPDGRLDRDRTLAVFGRPYIPPGHEIDYSPIDLEVGIFKYRNKTYFDSYFLTSDEYVTVARSKDRTSLDTLGVFFVRAHKVQQACQIHVEDEDRP